MLATQLFSSRVVGIREVACNAARGGDNGDEYNDAPSIAIPLRGCYAVEQRRGHAVADANTAIFFNAVAPYRVSHPADGGDATFVISCEAGALADAFGTARNRNAGLHPFPALHSVMRSKLQLQVRLLRRRLEGPQDPLAIEEAVLALIAALGCPRDTELSQRHARAVERSKAFLGQHFRDRVLLADVARATGISPFSLARVFHAATGMTLHRYLTALRHAAALEAITAGASDLARVAVDVGFAHHSHLTKTFSRALGTTPREARRLLGASTARRHTIYSET